MTDLNLRDLQTLTDLQAALARFASGTQDGLRAAEAETRRAQEWLTGRVHHWQRVVERARREAEGAAADLRACQASGYRDEDGDYHAPDCGGYARALAQAQARLREGEENLRVAQQWRSRVEAAADAYRREARRLGDLAGNHTERARAFLNRAAEKYRRVIAASRSIGSTGTFVAGLMGLLTQVQPHGTRGITWAEKRAILKKIDQGQVLSHEEFESLKLPITDLRAETLQPDEDWVYQLMEAERFREATRGLWTGETPEAQWGSVMKALLGVAVDTSKVIQHWGDLNTKGEGR